MMISAACHVGLFWGLGGRNNDDTAVYHIAMDESVNSVAVNIVAVKPKVKEIHQSKPKPPVKEEALLTTEEKTETVVEKIPPVEEKPKEEVFPDPPKLEPVEKIVKTEEPPQQIEEPQKVEEVQEVAENQQQESNVSARSQEMSGAFTKSYPIASRCPAPRYPRQAREEGVEGKVILKVTVDEGGKVKRVLLLRSSGSKILDRRAVITVRKRWHFEPARKGPKAVESIVNVELTFRLNRDASIRIIKLLRNLCFDFRSIHKQTADNIDRRVPLSVS